MATHSSILAWEVPWTEEPGGLQSMGSQKSQTQLGMHAHGSQNWLKHSSLMKQGDIWGSKPHKTDAVIPKVVWISKDMAEVESAHHVLRADLRWGWWVLQGEGLRVDSEQSQTSARRAACREWRQKQRGQSSGKMQAEVTRIFRRKLASELGERRTVLWAALQLPVVSLRRNKGYIHSLNAKPWEKFLPARNLNPTNI